MSYMGFKKLAKKVGPGLAATIGRKKYGKRDFQAHAAKGKSFRYYKGKRPKEA